MTKSKKLNFYSIVIVAFVVTAVNIATVGSVLGLLVAFPQIIIVYKLLLKGNFAKAFYWHLLFILLSISPGIAMGNGDGGEYVSLYNYANLKLVGPISLSYITSILFFILSIKVRSRPHKDRMLLKVFNILLFFAITGNLIGLFGLFFIKGYSFHTYFTSNIYIGMTLITIYTILKLLNEEYVELFYESAIPILSGSIIGATLGYFAGFTVSYGGLSELPMLPDAIYYATLIIISLLFVKNHVLFIFGIIGLYIYLSQFSMGGKTVIITVFGLCCMVYIVLFSKQYFKKYKKNIKKIRVMTICIISMSLISIASTVLSNTNSLTNHKIQSALSIFGGEVGEVSSSPYVRIAELFNFTYNNRYNPIFLLFGRGYGGFFTDELGMLKGMDLTGGWDDETVRSGYYTSAHDTLSDVPLRNGYVGLFLIFYLVWKYLKQLQKNYLTYAAVPWLLFTFYFTPSIAMSALFFLTGADYKKV